MLHQKHNITVLHYSRCRCTNWMANLILLSLVNRQRNLFIDLQLHKIVFLYATNSSKIMNNNETIVIAKEKWVQCDVTMNVLSFIRILDGVRLHFYSRQQWSTVKLLILSILIRAFWWVPILGVLLKQLLLKLWLVNFTEQYCTQYYDPNQK